MKLFYLQCRGVVGNSVLWWAANDAGYTCDIRCAKVWTDDEINAKTLRSFEKAWPKEQVDRVVQHHIDIQDLEYRNKRRPHRCLSAHAETMAPGLVQMKLGVD